jgi:hypothetical protein
MIERRGKSSIIGIDADYFIINRIKKYRVVSIAYFNKLRYFCILEMS